MSYYLRRNEEKYLKTNQSSSSTSKDKGKMYTSPNYYMTQSSFKSSNKSTYHATNSNYKSKTFIPRLQCTCNKGLQTIQKREVNSNYGINERNLSRTSKSRFDHSYNTINYRKSNKSAASNIRGNNFINNRKNYYTASSNSSKVCTCRNKRSNIPNLKTTNIENSASKKHIKPDENSYQLLSSHDSQISSLFMQNLDSMSKQGSIKILIPIEPGKIEKNYQLEILGTSAQKERKLQEKKESKKINKVEEGKKVSNSSIENKNKISKENKEIDKNISKQNKIEENAQRKDTIQKEQNKEADIQKEQNKEVDIQKEQNKEADIQKEKEEEEENIQKEKEEEENINSNENKDGEEEINENDNDEGVSTEGKEKGSLKIRANIVKVNDKEEKEESVSSEYDVLKKIAKYDELKYKTIVDQNLEIVEKELNQQNGAENEVKNEEINENINQENQVDMNAQNQNKPMEIQSPKTNKEKMDIIIDNVQSPEDSPFPVELSNLNKKVEIKSELIEQSNKIIENPLEQNINVENMNEFQNEVSGANNENVHIEGGEQYLNAQHNAQYGENVEYMENQIEENNFQENNQAYDTSNQNQEAQNEMKYEMVSFEMEENGEQNNVNNIENNENIEEQNINNGEEEQNIEEELEEEGEGEEEKNLSVNEKQENSEEKVGEEEDEENIEEQLVDYVEENNKISKEQFNKKIKVYNINDNKNIKLDVNEEQDPETMIIVISTSVKSSKNGISNASNINEIIEKENDEKYGPKNSIRKN